MEPAADVVINSLDHHQMDVADVCADLRKQRRKLYSSSFKSTSSPTEVQPAEGSSSMVTREGENIPKDSQEADFNSDCSLM